MNRLAGESSPYLRQHADNPVDWYPWGDEAFAAAIERDVPVLLSVGYSACHWCHVMAHQCFENDDVAMAMNRAFVNVKVDREERPDVDAVYMEAVQAMSGRGGWPMTVLMTPAGDPFFAATYLPPANLLQLIGAATDGWSNRRAELTAKSGPLRELLSRTARVRPAANIPGLDVVASATSALARAADPDWGGFGPAPKFPSTVNLELLLADAGGDHNSHAASIVATTLDAMAAGGLHDHLGGGFARYSVDERWLVPHFEKMLYDQALLLRVYVRAAASLPDHPSAPSWRQTAGELVEFVTAELRLDGGGFSSALDADSPGPDGHNHEGLYYTWTPDEVSAALDDERLAAAVCDYWDITADGNFESRSILNRLQQRGDLVRPAEIVAARQRLAEVRAQRLAPGRDDKVVTEWNALMIAALAEAGQRLDRPDWIASAVDAAQFLLAELRAGDGLDRRWHRVWHSDGDPPARHEALAADHAALVDAFTRLAEATGQRRWIDEATDVADLLLDRFWDADHGGLYTRPDRAAQLIVRQKDLFDNATPAANSSAALALVRLGALIGEQRYRNHAERILALVAAVVDQAPTAFGTALVATTVLHGGTIEVVIAGERPDLVGVAAAGPWLAPLVLAWGERYESPLWDGRADGQAYVCRQYTCGLPTANPAELRAQLLAT